MLKMKRRNILKDAVYATSGFGKWGQGAGLKMDQNAQLSDETRFE
ncbi:MAG: hypothetical protein ACI9OU_000039 [Candidatus Promineifilaceae bacterium]|jgi:hypothetical protein